MAAHPDRLRQSLADARRSADRAEGEATALEAREAQVSNEVALAKGRIELKPKVDLFLEELQAEAHQKRVGDFERLLTALVQEVLPGEFPIGLELHVERGQPSLDIVSRHGMHFSEDIYDDQGGALTNVVSLGLRMIAAVRSRSRRFLVLDESDCWVAVDRVPSFYRVVTEAAAKIGLQCFVISHHDVAHFGDDVAVARLSGDKDRGATVENAPRRHHWTPAEDGIASIRIRNFQSFVDETIHLTPGVNALVGPNNLGKSVVVRALRAVFHGECRDSLIRRGQRSCSVDLTFPDGRTLHWDRQTRRNPVNVWKLLGPDGAVVRENGMVYETGSRTTPEWVNEMFGIGPIEGLDVHVNKQKTPVFLLDKPGSTRAAVLSVGQESGHIRSMITLHKERCAQDAAKVRDGEREVARIRERREALSRLPAIREAIDAVAAALAGIEARAAEAVSLERVAVALGAAETISARSRAKTEALKGLPGHDVLERLRREAAEVASLDAGAARIEAAERALVRLRAQASALEALPAEFAKVVPSEPLIKAGLAVRNGVAKVASVAARHAVLAALPATMPQVEDSSVLVAAASSLETSDRRLSGARSAAASAERELAACARDLEELAADMGHSCPVCGAGIDDPSVLVGGHAHGGDHVHAS